MGQPGAAWGRRPTRVARARRDRAGPGVPGLVLPSPPESNYPSSFFQRTAAPAPDHIEATSVPVRARWERHYSKAAPGPRERRRCLSTRDSQRKPAAFNSQHAPLAEKIAAAL